MYSIKVTASKNGHTIELHRTTARGHRVPIRGSKTVLQPGVRPTIEDIEGVLGVRASRLLRDRTSNA